ncbi:MAG TPA: hypothetical protein VFJ46_17625 [Xanthobacteraceae bacterium]|nr:hypothetical protein [Xanthobacteraceae bacterium]
MPTYVALDLSVKSTGFAFWSDGQAKPACGTWALAPGIQFAGRAFVRLHRNLMDLHKVNAINELVFEEAIPPFMLQGHTNAETVAAAAGLAAHCMSFAEAIGARYRPVGIAAWRRHFIGKMPRGTKTPDLKAMAMKRCRELGFDAIKHDAAEACGLLDYQLSVAGVTPPWRMENALQQELLP